MGRAGDTIDDVNAVSIAEIWARVSGNKPFPANTLTAMRSPFSHP
jgi:hypothetical protein